MKNRENLPVFVSNPEVLGKVGMTVSEQRHKHQKIDEPLNSPWVLFLRDLWEVGGLGAALLVIFVVAYLIAQGGLISGCFRGPFFTLLPDALA